MKRFFLIIGFLGYYQVFIGCNNKYESKYFNSNNKISVYDSSYENYNYYLFYGTSIENLIKSFNEDTLRTTQIVYSDGFEDRILIFPNGVLISLLIHKDTTNPNLNKKSNSIIDYKNGKICKIVIMRGYTKIFPNNKYFNPNFLNNFLNNFLDYYFIHAKLKLLKNDITHY